MMMKVLVATLALVASVEAFAPSAKTAVTSKSQLAAVSFDDDIGVSGSLGYCWDPLNLVTGKSQENFDRFRLSEIKHGRVAMLAWLGYATTWSGYRLPGLLDPSSGLAFKDIPAGHAAVFAVPPAGIAQIVIFGGLMELIVWKQKEGSFPGDYSATSFPVGFGQFATSPEKQRQYRINELENGRCAMMGFLTVLVHEQIDGNPFIFFDKFEPYFPGGGWFEKL
jgi:hypothetical protein